MYLLVRYFLGGMEPPKDPKDPPRRVKGDVENIIEIRKKFGLQPVNKKVEVDVDKELRDCFRVWFNNVNNKVGRLSEMIYLTNMC